MRMRELFEGKTVKAAAPKPRNFVAKNAAATTSGAGAHKDKKKAAKQGVVKHKSKEMAEGKLDEVLNPTSVIAKALRYLGKKFATAFPYIVTGGAGAGLVASGLMAPLIASVGGATAFITSLSAEAALMGGAVGMAGAPSIIQVIKDLFSADENSIQAGIKRWVEKHVGDESDVSEFLSLHAKTAFTGQQQFRWRAKEWPVKMSTSDAEAYLEKHDKSWLDAEKEKQAGKIEKPVEEGSAHGYNVTRWYRKNRNPSKITAWLKKEAGLPKETKLYFDDADLVLGSDTIVPYALVDDTLKFNDLLTALVQATGGTAKQKVDGVYRDQGVAEVAGPKSCWPGHRKVGTQPGTGKNAGKRVNDCEKIGENLDEGAVKELSSDLKTMSDADFQASYKMSKSEARAGLRSKKESRSFFADPVMEKAVSTAQQQLMGMVHAAKKGAKPASKEVAKIAKGMSSKAAKDYASTKHKGLPKHVGETASAGATSAANVSVGPVYKNKKPKMQKPGTNALDGDNLMTGGSLVKR